MTRSGSENAVNFIGMKHLNTADTSSTYGVLRVRAAAVDALDCRTDAMRSCHQALELALSQMLRG